MEKVLPLFGFYVHLEGNGVYSPKSFDILGVGSGGKVYVCGPPPCQAADP